MDPSSLENSHGFYSRGVSQATLSAFSFSTKVSTQITSFAEGLDIIFENNLIWGGLTRSLFIHSCDKCSSKITSYHGD